MRRKYYMLKFCFLKKKKCYICVLDVIWTYIGYLANLVLTLPLHLVYEYCQFFFFFWSSLSRKSLYIKQNEETMENFNVTLEITVNFCFDTFQGNIEQAAY